MGHLEQEGQAIYGSKDESSSSEETGFNHKSPAEAEIAAKKDFLFLPCKRVFWVCTANLGRSPMAEAEFRKRYPGLPVDSAAVFDYENQRDPLVMSIMQALGYDMSWYKRKTLQPGMLDGDTDLMILTNVRLVQQVHPYAIKDARSAVAFPTHDPSDPLQFRGQIYSMENELLKTKKRLDKLIQDEIPDIMLKVRKGYSYDMVNGIIYPFGYGVYI